MSGLRSGMRLLTRKPKTPKRGEVPSIVDKRSSSSSTSTSSPQQPFLYRARGIFGALLGLNLFVAGYMLFRGPSRRHSKEGEETSEERGEGGGAQRHDRPHSQLKETLVPQKTGPAHQVESTPKLQDGRTSAGWATVGKEETGNRDVSPEALMLAGQETTVESPAADDETTAHVLQEESNREAIEVVNVSLPSSVIPVFKEHKPMVSIEQQKEIFEWILAEKRKVKPSSPAEKRKIDEDKRLLKDFIRAKKFISLDDHQSFKYT